MSKKRIYRAIALIGILSMALISCGKGSLIDELGDKPDLAQGEEIVLELYSHFGGFEGAIRDFEKLNPNIKVNITVFPYGEYESRYKESLIKEKGDADLFIIDSNHYGNFTTVKGLENLLGENYNAKDYEKDFDKELWELGMSLDKSKLLGISLSTAPIVTYYRADILEKYGFPTDPKLLAEYMKDKDNWLKIARKLKGDGKYAIQWVAESVKIYTADIPYFNGEYEYQRDSDEFAKAIDIAREIKNDGLTPYMDIWSDNGKTMLKEDKFAMLYLGSWGARDLEAMVPEQAGKWRVTSLPFGVYGWSNASILSMAENSTKKEAAWKFMEFCAFKHTEPGRLGNVSGYLPFRNLEQNTSYTNNFLGGQKEQELYEEVMSKTNEYQVTPLDAEAFLLWDEVVNEGLEEGLSTPEIMSNIRKRISERFSKEIDILKGNN